MPTLHLVPRPRRCAIAAGQCASCDHNLTVHPVDAAREPVQMLATALRLTAVADDSVPPHTAAIGSARLPRAPKQAAGYGLRITTDGVALRGSDAHGLVWGLQTLRQILAQHSSPPCLEISDWPTYAIRYHHDDISRKQVSTVEDFCRIIRNLSLFKFSHYTPYIEDMLQVPGIPLMGEGRGALSVEDVRAVVAEGERWQVEVFPTLSLAGHQENLMRYPRYRGLGAATWQPPSSFDPALPGVRDHLLKVLDAACPLFPSPLFHCCFDEVIGLDAESFLDHANWCAEQLVARGKTPIFWADMLYNHFGCDLLDRLHPALVPVAWGYGAKEKAHTALPKLLRHRPQAWVLAGYNNCCSLHHPPLADQHRQWEAWRRVAPPRRVSAFGSSQWGDHGYENLRDGVWPVLAAFAEEAWSGEDHEPESVEARYQTVFHGHPLPALTQLRSLLSDGLHLSPGRAWRLHRLPAPGWVRLAASGDLPALAALRADVARLAKATRLLAACQEKAVREREQLLAYQVAIDRTASVIARARAAYDRRLLGPALTALERARRSYRRAWLAHNRPENIEVSLRVYDQQRESWRSLQAKPVRLRRDWHPLDLGALWTMREVGVAGLPIGAAVLDGVPFRFAPVDATHAEVATGTTITLALPEVPIRDLHLVATQASRGETPHPGARLRLLRQDRVVYEEELLTIRHLCDWWAPLGEHIWAGGGFAYVDPMRVRYLLSPNAPYGLTCIHRFPWPAAPVADRLELTALGKEPIQLFALTVEEARR